MEYELVWKCRAEETSIFRGTHEVSRCSGCTYNVSVPCYMSFAFENDLLISHQM